MQTVFCYFDMINAVRHIDPLEVFSGLIAALAHDIGHTGYNNAFLVRKYAVFIFFLNVLWTNVFFFPGPHKG